MRPPTKGWLCAAALLLLVTACSSSGPPGDSGEDAGTDLPPPNSCAQVESFEDAGNRHVAEGTQVDSYNSEPPTSGPHYATPADPGFYSTPLPAEQLVHNLEHGQIVIYYSADAAEDVIGTLLELIGRNQVALVIAPYEDAAGPTEIIFTAWTHLQRCNGFSGDDLDAFRREHQGKGPENVGIPTFAGAGAQRADSRRAWISK